MSRDVKQCAMPDCTNQCAAMGYRGENSPIVQAGGDRSKRSNWCRTHLKGKLKSERKAYIKQLKEGAA